MAKGLARVAPLAPTFLTRRRYGQPEYRPPSDAELLAELRALGLAARPFAWPLYRDRLARYLDVVIRVLRLDEVEHPVLKARLNQHKINGGLFREPEQRRAWIVVPTLRSQKAWVRIVLHELSHVAAGHEVPETRLLLEEPARRVGGDRPPWRPGPEERLAVADPPEVQRLRELDADRRADYLLKASVFGRKLYLNDAYFMGIKGR